MPNKFKFNNKKLIKRLNYSEAKSINSIDKETEKIYLKSYVTKFCLTSRAFYLNTNLAQNQNETQCSNFSSTPKNDFHTNSFMKTKSKRKLENLFMIYRLIISK